MEINLQESTGWFKFADEFANVKGNIIFFEKCLFHHINFIYA